MKNEYLTDLYVFRIVVIGFVFWIIGFSIDNGLMIIMGALMMIQLFIRDGYVRVKQNRRMKDFHTLKVLFNIDKEL